MIIPSRRFVFLIMTFSMAVSLAAQSYRVVGYYPMWNKAVLPSAAVHFSSLTHIIHAFAWPNQDGSLAPGEMPVDTSLISATHKAGKKILLSFGGAGSTQAANFSIVAGDSALRSRFASAVVAHLLQYHYDGIDLDWEGPSSRADRAGEVLLVHQLKTAMLAKDPGWVLTMAIGMSNWSDQWHDVPSLLSDVDWFNAMEYDVHGSWSQYAGHNAPLYAGTDPVSDPDNYSIDQSVQYLTVTRGIPKSKLTLGLPFYGKLFGTPTLYSSYNGEQDLAYHDILTLVQSGTWTYIWDAGSMAPYYQSPGLSKLITLDDSTSIALKCRYARDNGLSGVMIWELSQDVIGSRQPLLDVVSGQMQSVTNVQEFSSAPQASGFYLNECYPNPFNPSTTITYGVAEPSRVSLRVFDLFGRSLGTLVDEFESAGVKTVRLSASSYNLSSGVYFVRLQAGSWQQTRRLIVLK